MDNIWFLYIYIYIFVVICKIKPKSNFCQIRTSTLVMVFVKIVAQALLIHFGQSRQEIGIWNLNTLSILYFLNLIYFVLSLKFICTKEKTIANCGIIFLFFGLIFLLLFFRLYTYIIKKRFYKLGLSKFVFSI